MKDKDQKYRSPLPHAGEGPGVRVQDNAKHPHPALRATFSHKWENEVVAASSKSLFTRILLIFILSTLITACGFKLQNEKPLALPLQRMYLKSSDPYGVLERNLKNYLKAAKVQLTNLPLDAKTILVIAQIGNSQELLSVSGTQQTRQYILRVTVQFYIADNQENPITSMQALTESRTITIQSSQILGSSNEANLFYQQMRRALAYAIINRINSNDITIQVNDYFLTNRRSST